MQIYRARAFTYPKKIEGKEVIGNPASVVICEKEFPSQKKMSEIAVGEGMPMTAFVKKANREKVNEFDIRYFAPNGEEFNLCGHATLVATYFLNKIYNIPEFLFHLSDSFKKIKTRYVRCAIKENIIKVDMPAFSPARKNIGDFEKYVKIFGLSRGDLLSCYVCNELKDYIIVLGTNSALRDLSYNKSDLSKQLKSENVRGIFITALSKYNIEIDYEVRIFAPHLGIEEDISCGSANCSLLPLWSDFLQTQSGKNLNILCPYKNANKFGGIEKGSYDKTNGRVSVGGLISEIKNTY